MRPGGPVSIAVSPDKQTLLVLTGGCNLFQTSTGALDTAASSEYICLRHLQAHAGADAGAADPDRLRRHRVHAGRAAVPGRRRRQRLHLCQGVQWLVPERHAGSTRPQDRGGQQEHHGGGAGQPPADRPALPGRCCRPAGIRTPSRWQMAGSMRSTARASRVPTRAIARTAFRTAFPLPPTRPPASRTKYILQFEQAGFLAEPGPPGGRLVPLTLQAGASNGFACMPNGSVANAGRRLSRYGEAQKFQPATTKSLAMKAVCALMLQPPTL